MELGLKKQIECLQEMIGKRPDKERENVSIYLAEMAASPNPTNADPKTLPHPKVLQSMADQG